ncbi:MAG: TetR/AcrR family transcriptional regulator [Flavobacteriales bacterium]
MGKTRDNATRQRIIDTAMALFRRKGMDGLSMRELAEEAGVNKGLLHYYFKTKEAIFQEVFAHHAGLLWADVLVIVEGPGDLGTKLPRMVDRYFDLLDQYPSLPAFVLFEVQRDPSMLLKTAAKDAMLRAATIVEPELRRLRLPAERASGVQFMLDLVGLCAFTYGMLPGVVKVLGLNKAQRNAFLLQRKTHIIALLQQGIEP